MGGEVIKSFLVGLGFAVDDSSLAKFNKAIVSASIRVTALYTSIQLVAAGIFKSIAGISSGFEEMGYSLRLVGPAINKMLILRHAMLEAYQKAGINLQEVVRNSILFNYSLAKTKFALEAIYKSVGAKFLPLLTKQMDIFRLKIFQNMPKIQEQLRRFVDFVFKAFSATAQLGTTLYSILSRVWDLFVRLDEVTGGWSTKILAFVAAWNLLNLSFLATPLGAILAGLLAILALYDDFKVWQEGGKSFFNWAPALPVIKAVGDALSWVASIVAPAVSDSFQVMTKALNIFFSTLFQTFGLLNDLVHLDFKRVAIDFENLFHPFTGAAAGANITAPGPLLPQGASNTQKVNQQTNINVQGTADANAVGRAVAGQQDRVNFDMTRNLKGAIR